MNSVRSKVKPTKREAILDATLDVVVERGFHEAPMSLISERSGASRGVIYAHFESKEEIVQALHTSHPCPFHRRGTGRLCLRSPTIPPDSIRWPGRSRPSRCWAP